MSTTMDSDISPEKEASFRQFLWRQFFVVPTPVLPHEADLRGMAAIVTGSNGGIGLECCRQLRQLGLGKLIIAVRNESKGRRAMQELRSDGYENGQIEVWHLDLSSYASIATFTQRAAASLDRLDLVILNAGITRATFQLNPTTGHEDNIQINLLSNSFLAISLLPVLKAKRPMQPHAGRNAGRILLVTSDAGPWGKFPEQDTDPLLPAFDESRKMDMVSRYYTSKLLQQFFVSEIAKRVPRSVATICAVTPGLVYGTESLKELTGIGGRAGRVFTRLIGYSPTVGAHQLVDAAVRHGGEIHGQYLCSQKIKPMAPLLYSPKGKQIAARLWNELMANEFSFADANATIRAMNDGPFH